MKPSPVILDYLRPRDWRQLVRAATLLDISAGDYFDVRVNGITLWAGPENKPAGWPPDLRIVGGDRAHPRSLVAAISYDWGDDLANWASTAAWPVLLQICIPDVRDWRLATAARAWQPYDPELARVVDDEAWCRRQWQRLKEFAEVPSRRP